MPDQSKKRNNSKVVKKKATENKSDDLLTSNYIPKNNEKLIVDKPSTPLTLKRKKIENVAMKSNKELYESYIKDLKNYSLVLNGEVVYDSSIDKSNKKPLLFENDYFVLYGKKYSYNGLRIKKIN